MKWRWRPGPALRLLALAAAALLQGAAAAASAQAAAKANPLRRVVELLWDIKKKVEAEGQIEEELFKRYECFCKTGKTNLQGNIARQRRKEPKVQGNLGARQSSLAGLESELSSNEQERQALQEKQAQAKALRVREADSYRKEADETRANIAACGKAIDALRNAGVDSFLQTEDATVLRRLVANYQVRSEDREALRALLHGRSVDGASVIGVLSVLKGKFEENLAAAGKDEAQAQADFLALMDATKKEAKALTVAIEAKLERSAKLKVDIVETEDDEESTAESLQRDEAFMGQMSTTCTTLENTYRTHKKMRMEEVTTIADTIHLLGSDEAQDLFRARSRDDDGAEPSAPSFLQVAGKSKLSRKVWRKEALRLLKAARDAQNGHRIQLDLLMLALKGKHEHQGFDKIVTMIDDMISLGRKEQASESQKRDRCQAEIRDNGRDLKEVEFTISSQTKEIQDMSENSDVCAGEISALKEAIKNMDTAMDGATQDRKANHAEYLDLIESNRKAVEILSKAKERLFQFYNPAIAAYSAPVEGKDVEKPDHNLNPNQFGPGAMHMMRGMTGLAQEEALEAPLAVADMDGDEEPPNGGDLGKYHKASEVSAGALELIEKIRLQVQRDTEEAQVEEKNHAASYKMMLENAKAKRETLVHEMMSKQAAHARMGEDMHHLRGKRGSAQARQKNLLEYGQSLQQECSWLLQHYDAREAARQTEEDSLRQAKDILSGA